MDRYTLRATWLYYNSARERWFLAATDEEMLSAKLFILPTNSNPVEGYEAGQRMSRSGKPCLCPQYQGHCLCSIDVSRHGIPPVC